jgi:hypothetical protein
MRKFKDMYLKLHNNMLQLKKTFVFGDKSGQVKARFIWFDSILKTRVDTQNALVDALSAKFNYAVALARISCYMSLEGDGIKVACKQFQQAAWIFEDLI